MNGKICCINSLITCRENFMNRNIKQTVVILKEGDPKWSPFSYG